MHEKSFASGDAKDGRGSPRTAQTHDKMALVVLNLLLDVSGGVSAKLHVVRDDGGESVQAVLDGVLGVADAAGLLASGTVPRAAAPTSIAQPTTAASPAVITPEQRARMEVSRQKARARLSTPRASDVASSSTAAPPVAVPSASEVTPVELCPNGHGACDLRTSATERNPGRTFYRCGAPTCTHFRWADEPPRAKRSICFTCGNDGHWSRDCPKRQR